MRGTGALHGAAIDHPMCREPIDPHHDPGEIDGLRRGLMRRKEAFERSLLSAQANRP